ncbi:MAG: hypothetical protein KUG68_04280 [Flavobacteriaceae bacterium]|nr:hypothetical protein [Flavobacteriaceae bacterium]
MNTKYLLFLVLVPILLSFSINQKSKSGVPKNGPIEVSVTLRINKIYNINSVNETYQIDGYLIYSWVDERAKFNPNDSLSNSIIYENEKSREFIKENVWIPAFELINVQGSGETPNTRIELYSDGTIELEERFFDTFSSDMDYTKFPFDSQNYKVEIEAFSYGKGQIVFKNPKLFLEDDHQEYLGEDWTFIDSNTSVSTKNYRYMDEDVDSEKNHYSRVSFEVNAKRLSGYYEWQVLFPLLIIILASFAIFWIEEFSTQIGVGFTLMLTVVASIFIQLLSYPNFLIIPL